MDQTVSPAAFQDLSGISAGGKAAVESLQKAGIIKGKKTGVFDPNSSASRAEAAAILASAAKLTDKVVENVVQSSNWWDALPRESWSQFEKVTVKEDWFEVYKLPGNVYAIYEPGQFQEVISFLILGDKKALLWDTGMGIGDIKSCVGELTNLPVFVVNSHSHMDHIGGNWQFDEIYIYDMVKYLGKVAPNHSKIALISATDEFFYPFFEENPTWKIYPLRYETLFKQKNYNDYDFIIIPKQEQCITVPLKGKLKYNYKIFDHRIIYNQNNPDDLVIIYNCKNRQEKKGGIFSTKGNTVRNS
jgi:mRNA-degrading endonuclease RelE of RelBE toxin-antitoxin system